MALSLDVSLASMISPLVHYQTQNLTLDYSGKIGGKEDSVYGNDIGFRGRGLPFWRGTVEIAPSDRGSLVDTSIIESVLMRIQRPGAVFACPIIRETDRLWQFQADKTGQTTKYPIDSQLCNGTLSLTANAVEKANTYSLMANVSLATPDATLSNLEFAVLTGAYVSVGGFLYMITASNVFGTAISDIEPKKGLAELTMGAELDWRLPWIAARIPQGYSIQMPRYGSTAGPWSFEFEEAN